VQEHQGNKNGGRFMMDIKNEYADQLWEDLLLGFIGNLCEENDHIAGVMIQTFDNYSFFQIWTKDCEQDQPRFARIDKWIRASLGFSEKMKIEYLPHVVVKKNQYVRAVIKA